MKRWMVAALVILAVGVGVIADTTDSSTCTPTLNGVYNKKEIHLSLPVSIIAKVAKMTGLPFTGDVTVGLRSSLTLNLNCGCHPCCKSPLYQYAELNAWGQASAWGGTVYWSEDVSSKMPGKDNPDPNKTCTVEVAVKHEGGVRLTALGMGLAIGGTGVSVAHTKMAFSATTICKCSQNPRCAGNVMPIVVSSVKELDVYPDRPAVFTVTAFDRNGNLTTIGSSEGDGLYPASLDHLTIADDGTAGKATFIVRHPGPGGPLDSTVEIDAWDSCGGRGVVRIPVHFHYPPQITIESTKWDDNVFDIGFRVSDPELAGCSQGHRETVTLEPPKAVGGDLIYGFVPGLAGPSCSLCPPAHLECIQFGIQFFPKPSARKRSVTIEAKDLYGLWAINSVSVLNRAPVFDPQALKEEKTVYYEGGGGLGVSKGAYLLMSPSWEHIACFTVTDPDGDDLSISLGSAPRYGMANVFSSRTGPGTYNVTVSYQISNARLRKIHESRDDLTDSFTLVANDGQNMRTTAWITITIEVPNAGSAVVFNLA